MSADLNRQDHVPDNPLWRRARNALLGTAHRRGADLGVTVGDLKLNNPIMTAAGTYGLGSETDAYGDLTLLGAFVTKSLSNGPWKGNVGRNLVPGTGTGMLNSVGLKNPGVRAWAQSHYPELARRGVRTVVSIWGRDENELFDAAAVVAACKELAAIEVNLSCPNHDDPRLMVSHDPEQVRKYISVAAAATSGSVPVWAKLAPTTPDIVACAGAAQEAGASVVTLVNTLSAMSVDLDRGSVTLSGVLGGMSGPPLHEVALRAIYQVRSAFPRLPIVGVGGVVNARTALELMAVGASAVQVGTACFVDPRAPYKIIRGIDEWCARRRTTLAEVIGSIV